MVKSALIRLLRALLWKLTPADPYMIIEEVERYGDEIISMVSNRGELWLATRSGRIYRVKESW